MTTDARIPYRTTWVPHNYYSHPTSQPVVCEISEDGYVFFFHDESLRPKSAYGGKFVRLIEAPDGDEEASDSPR